jgi:glucose 1-dehydrogenase
MYWLNHLLGTSGLGRFLSIGSVQQYLPSKSLPIYAATKAAQFSLVKYLANVYGPKGISSDSISPGLIATDRNAHRRESVQDWEALSTAICPLQRAGTSEDIKGAALLLYSDAGSYINGADIQVDGGLLLRAAD